MIAAIRAQWLILRRRPLLWSLLAAHFLLLLAQMLLPVLLIGSAAQLNERPGQPDALPPEMLEQMRLQSLAPGVFAAIFGHVNGIGGLLFMVLCGAFIGSDYNWGTLRTQLARAPGRAGYLLSKLGALALLALLMVLATLLVGTLLALLNSALLSEPFQLSADLWLELALGAARAVYGLLPFALVAVCCAVAGRSTLAGVAGSLLYWILEVALGFLSILRSAGSAGKAIYDLTLSQNVAALTEITRRNFGLGLEQTMGGGGLDLSLPPPGRAALLLLAYMAALLALAIYLLRRRDIFGSS